MVNIFQNGTKSIPTSDPKIVRVDMEQMDIGGRKSHMPKREVNTDMAIKHVPNADGP